MGFWKNIRQGFRGLADFLRLSSNRELLSFLFFLALAALAWFLQDAQTEKDGSFNIPVRYSAVPDSITIVNDLPAKARVTIHDKGSVLARYSLMRKSLAMDIDLMVWRSRDGIGHIPLSFYEGRLSSKLKPSSQILRISPDSILVYFVEKERKEVPVRLEADIQLAEQYTLTHEPIVTPSTVTVYAPPAILENLDAVETEHLSVKELKDTMELTVKLKAIEGGQLSQPGVLVCLTSEAYTECTMSVPVGGKNFPDGIQLHAFPQQVQVTFLIAEKYYSGLRVEDFSLCIDYEALRQSPNELQPVLMERFPEQARNIRIRPEKVDCLIEKR